MEVEIHLYVYNLKLLFRNQALCFQSHLTVSKLRFFFLILGVCFQWTYYVSNTLCMFPITVFPVYGSKLHIHFVEKKLKDLLGKSFPSVSNK